MHRTRKTCKAILTVLLATVLAFSTFAAPVFAKQGWYYVQLDEKGRTLFEKLDADTEAKKGNKDSSTVSGGFTVSKQMFYNVLDAFYCDNLDLFWSKHDLKGSFGSEMTVEWLKEKDWDSGSRTISTDAAKMDTAVKQLATEAKNHSSNVAEQLLYVHDWLVINNDYNEAAAAAGGPSGYGSAIPWTPLSGLFSELSPVCEGYSRAFKLVCDELGVNSVVVSGMAYSSSGHSELHMWNMVEISGAWYGVDCTWDDPIVVDDKGKRHKDQENKNVGDKAEYFLVGSTTVCDGKTFGSSHVPNENCSIQRDYPSLAASKYNGYTPTPTPTPTGDSVTMVKFTPKSTKVDYTHGPINVYDFLQTDGKVTLTQDKKSKALGTLDPATGIVTLHAGKSGNIKITATGYTSKNKKKTATFTIKINGPVRAKSVKVQKFNKTPLGEGESLQLHAYVTPSNAIPEDQELEYTVVSKGKDAGNAEVTQEGLVTCRGAGTIKIQIAVKNNPKKKVTVSIKGPKHVASVTINKEKGVNYSKLEQGKTYKLDATVKPAVTILSERELTWWSDNENVAKVEDGNVTTIGAGKAKIWVRTANGKKKSLSIKVL